MKRNPLILKKKQKAKKKKMAKKIMTRKKVNMF